MVYYGPGAADPSARPVPLLQTRAVELREAMEYYVEPALDLVQLVLTLNVALEPKGVNAGALVLGGLIRGGDIHRVVLDSVGPEQEIQFPILDPDSIADVAWTLAKDRVRPEVTFDALTSMTPRPPIDQQHNGSAAAWRPGRQASPLPQVIGIEICPKPLDAKCCGVVECRGQGLVVSGEPAVMFGDVHVVVGVAPA